MAEKIPAEKQRRLGAFDSDEEKKLIANVLHVNQETTHRAPAEKTETKKALETKEKERLTPEAYRDMVYCKFQVPREMYVELKRLLQSLELELGCKIDVANFGRGWIERALTAERALLDAAKMSGRRKTPSKADTLGIAELDHALAVIQAGAFRRAKGIE